jgi:hypothetical protein
MQETDETPEMTDRLEELEARLARIETRWTSRGRSLMSRMVPRDAQDHFRAASKEQLLGIRALVDHWIRRLDENEPLPQALDREEIPID